MMQRNGGPGGPGPLPIPTRQLAGANNCPMGCGQDGGITMVQAMHPNPAILTTKPLKNSFSICYVCLARWETAPDGTILNLRQPASVFYDPKTGAMLGLGGAKITVTPEQAQAQSKPQDKKPEGYKGG